MREGAGSRGESMLLWPSAAEAGDVDCCGGRKEALELVVHGVGAWPEYVMPRCVAAKAASFCHVMKMSRDLYALHA